MYITTTKRIALANPVVVGNGPNLRAEWKWNYRKANFLHRKLTEISVAMTLH
jgi:hypothetical protein